MYVSRPFEGVCGGHVARVTALVHCIPVLGRPDVRAGHDPGPTAEQAWRKRVGMRGRAGAALAHNHLDRSVYGVWGSLRCCACMDARCWPGSGPQVKLILDIFEGKTYPAMPKLGGSGASFSCA